MGNHRSIRGQGASETSTAQNLNSGIFPKGSNLVENHGVSQLDL